MTWRAGQRDTSFSLEEPIRSKEHVLFLEALAKAFMVNRYLTAERKDYSHFIYTIDKASSEARVKSEAEILSNINLC